MPVLAYRCICRLQTVNAVSVVEGVYGTYCEKCIVLAKFIVLTNTPSDSVQYVCYNLIDKFVAVGSRVKDPLKLV